MKLGQLVNVLADRTPGPLRAFFQKYRNTGSLHPISLSWPEARSEKASQAASPQVRLR